jgi:hypothetical protein
MDIASIRARRMQRVGSEYPAPIIRLAKFLDMVIVVPLAVVRVRR